NAAAFEAGTVNFLCIPAVSAGLEFLESLGMERVQRHGMGLTDLLLRELQEVKHPNGAPLVRLYGPRTTEGRGGTIAFNLLDPTGTEIDCRLVEQAAAEANISIRTGYFCNPGAAEASFELPEDEARRCYEELAGDTFTLKQFSVCLHDKPVGAVRASLGLSSTEADVRRFVELLGGFAKRAAASA